MEGTHWNRLMPEGGLLGRDQGPSQNRESGTRRGLKSAGTRSLN